MALFLPSFPLNLVVYPGEKLRLYIFELRYRQLIRECLDKDSTFVIPTVLNESLAEYATEVKIVSLDKDFPTGEMNITTEGVGRVRIHEFQMVATGKLYPSSAIERLIDEVEDEDLTDLKQEVYEMAQELHDLLEIEGKLPQNSTLLESFTIGHHVGMSLAQEYELLTQQSEKARFLIIKAHLRKILPVVVETERLKSKAQLNGHFKNLVPPRF